MLLHRRAGILDNDPRRDEGTVGRVFRLLGALLRFGDRLHGRLRIQIDVAARLNGALVGYMSIIVDDTCGYRHRELLRADRLGEQIDCADRLETYVHGCFQHTAVQHLNDCIRKDYAGIECRFRIVGLVSLQGCLCKSPDISECRFDEASNRNSGCEGLDRQNIEIVFLKNFFRLDRRLRLRFDADSVRCDRSVLRDIDRCGVHVECISYFDLLNTRDLDRKFRIDEHLRCVKGLDLNCLRLDRSVHDDLLRLKLQVRVPGIEISDRERPVVLDDEVRVVLCSVRLRELRILHLALEDVVRAVYQFLIVA